MNKKLLLGMLSIAIVAVIGLPAMMDTWNSCTITMHASSGGSAGIGQFTDCLCTIPLTTYTWPALAQQQTYEMPVYVKNTGNMAVELYFFAYPTSANKWIPTLIGTAYPGFSTIYFNNQQVSLSFEMTAITHEGAPCELDTVNYVPGYGDVPCKFTALGMLVDPVACPGYQLDPGKVIKFDVKMTTGSLVSGASYDFTFTIDGLTF